MRKGRKYRYSREEREELLDLYRQSGYSVWKFCNEMNLGYVTLKRWLADETSSYSLVEVTTAEEANEASIGLSVRLPNGIVCELGNGLSPEEMLNWVRELKRC